MQQTPAPGSVTLRQDSSTARPWLPGPASMPLDEAEAAVRPGVDRRNVLLIVAGFLAVLLLIPPGHEYPIIDDWIYARAVQNELATGSFVMPPQSQANLAGLALWGTGWARVFGFSYTTLTWSTLAFALVALVAFYGLARLAGVLPAGALLGTALLGFNPLFLHLSYSFMTDVPFLALVLVACYGYVRSLQTGAAGWLVGAGLAAGWGFTIRQFAILVPLAFLGYLLLDGLLTGRWRGRALLLVALAPAVTEAAWWLWTHDWPETPFSYTADALRASFVLQEPWLRVFVLRALASVPLLALMAWTAVHFRRARWALVGLWAVLLAGAWVWVAGLQETWIGTTEPPVTVQLGPLALTLPQQIDTYIGDGNVLRSGGFDFFQYRQAAIWTPGAWAAIFVGTSVLGVLLLAKLSDGLLDWLGERLRRRPLAPLAGVYLTGLATFVVTLAIAGDYFDRYLLGFAPFVILFMVRGARSWSRPAWRYSLVTASVLALFTLLLQRDFVAHDNARWEAAAWLAARAQPVQVGFDYNNIHPPGNGGYEITDLPIDGFRTERAFPYQSWLTLGTRTVLAQTRADLPPLPPPAPAP